MKKIVLIYLTFMVYGCNMSDQEYELPSGYFYFREGGYSNVVIRNNKSIIDHTAIAFSYNEKYIMFAFDTVQKKPKRIEVKKIFFLVHDIAKNSLSKRLNYDEYKEFIKEEKIKEEDDLSLRKY